LRNERTSQISHVYSDKRVILLPMVASSTTTEYTDKREVFQARAYSFRRSIGIKTRDLVRTLDPVPDDLKKGSEFSQAQFIGIGVNV